MIFNDLLGPSFGVVFLNQVVISNLVEKRLHWSSCMTTSQEQGRSWSSLGCRARSDCSSCTYPAAFKGLASDAICHCLGRDPLENILWGWPSRPARMPRKGECLQMPSSVRAPLQKSIDFAPSSAASQGSPAPIWTPTDSSHLLSGVPNFQTEWPSSLSPNNWTAGAIDDPQWLDPQLEIPSLIFILFTVLPSYY